MAHKQLLKRLSIPVLFILVGVVARIVPHVPNFTPIAALALFGGTYFNKKQAFVLPILVMVLSDLVLGFDSLPMRLTVYGSFLLMVAVGKWFGRNKNIGNLILASLFGSVFFFITTNFMVWAEGVIYAKDLSGLVQSYYFAIPFFKNTVFGDLFYSGLFFGGYEFIKNLTGKNNLALERQIFKS